MKTQKISLNYLGKKINLEVEVCSELGKFRGLMFCRRENAEALLFEFKKSGIWPIHSLFVYFPFIAIWLDDKNKVIEIRRVRSWKLSVKPKKKYCKLVEIPVNKKYESICKLFDDYL